MAGSKAVLGTITTDANGEGTYTVTKDNGNKELTYDKTYTLLQTARDSRYTLADPADVTINDTLSQKKYAFSFVDTNACVLLKYKLDARTGEKTPEKGAVFEIIQLSSDNKDEAAKATTATDAPEEGTTAGASGETKGDTGGTQPAFPMTVTTNDAGIIDLSVPPEDSYTIHQTDGEEGYSYTDDISIRVDADGKVYEGDSKTATISIIRTDYSEGNGLSIKKNLVENPDKPDEKTAESGAVFTVIDTEGITSDELAAVRKKLTTLVTLNLREEYSLADLVFCSDDAMKTETIKHGKQSNRIYSFTADGVKEIKAKVSVKKQKKDDNTDESIRMEGLRKDVEKQGIDVSAKKAGIDALAQKNGENITQVRDLTRDLEKSEQKLERSEEELVDVRKELQYYKEELAQSQRENQQLKQQIYNLQHPQQSWDEPER